MPMTARIQRPDCAPDGALRLRLGGADAAARPSGALWLPARRLLAVADLHLGKAERLARRGGALLPPFETQDTLARLAGEIAALDPAVVVCLGDSFDDGAAAASLSPALGAELARLAAGRRWVWIGGNHDPAPTGLGGEWHATLVCGGLTFRHVAAAAEADVSGHYHPKATVALRGRRVTRRCFLTDGTRTILPAFGTYTGGLDATASVFRGLFPDGARALLTGRQVTAIPLAALVPR
jgi:DNA ligase-associated metallophosphoesterase